MNLTRLLPTSLIVAASLVALAAPGASAAAPAGPHLVIATASDTEDQADDLYDTARDTIEEGKYDRALEQLNRLIAMKSSRTDAALYWKAYCLAKLGQRDQALTTVADLSKQFANSRWLKDAKALEVEVRQASGQTVSPASQDDEELKLLALRGLMQSDPEQAFPVMEKMLAGTNSPKVKDRALFVLSQSRNGRAREIIAGVARGNGNPDLQLKAIRYLGLMGNADDRVLLADIYKGAADVAVKRAILRGFMMSGDRDRLVTLAKTESDASLRGEAVRQLGVMHGTAELSQLYQSESSVDVKKQILQAMFIGGDSAKLLELARTEKDVELRKTAVRSLGMMKIPANALTGIYESDASPEVRKSVVTALFIQQNAAALVALARAEKNVEMKKDIVSKLSLMKSKEATDYMLELLK